MPPEHPTPILAQNSPVQPKQKQREPLGPIVGAGIVIVLLIIGALYFWGAALNAKERQAPLPFITGDPVTPSE